MGLLQERGEPVHLPERWAVLEQALAEIAADRKPGNEPDAEDDEE